MKTSRDAHHRLLCSLYDANGDQSESSNTCRTCTLITFTNIKYQSTHHVAVLANGHVQSVTNYAKGDQECVWRISTIQTKRLCIFSGWFQEFEAQDTEIPYHFVLKIPDSLIDGSKVSLANDGISADDPDDQERVAYRYRNLGISIEDGFIQFSLRTNRNRLLDAVSGFFEQDDVSNFG